MGYITGGKHFGQYTYEHWYDHEYGEKNEINEADLTEKSIIFRKLNENDKDLFIKLRMDFFLDYYNLNETEIKQIKNSLDKYFNEHINQNDFIGMVAEYNGNIASVVYLIITDKPANPNFIDGKTGTIMNVFTYPEYRRKGLAKKIIKEIIKQAKEKGVGYIDLMATEAGYDLYKRLGFNDSKDKGMWLKI